MKNSTQIVLLIFLFTLFSASSLAQNKSFLKGIVVEAIYNNPIEGANVSLFSKKDSTLVNSTSTDNKGYFIFQNIPYGLYYTVIKHSSKKSTGKEININEKTLDLGVFSMEENVTFLKEVTVNFNVPVRLKNDTLEFNPSLFKIKPDDNLQDVIKQVPGMELDKDGNLIYLGQRVHKIMVEGKEFFGTNTAMAAKNIQADAISKLQVLDDKTDQAKATGVDDGQRIPVVNLKIKESRKNNWSGNGTLIGGNKDRYSVQANLNRFESDKQISITLSSNNIGKTMGLNTQNNVGFNYTNLYFKKKLSFNISYYLTRTTQNLTKQSKIQEVIGTSLLFTNQATKENTNIIDQGAYINVYLNLDSLTHLEFKPNITYLNSKRNFLNSYNSFDVNSVLINSGNQTYQSNEITPYIEGEISINRQLKNKKGSINFFINKSISKPDFNFINTSSTSYNFSSAVQDSSYNQQNFQNNNLRTLNTSLSFLRPLNTKKDLILSIKQTYNVTNSNLYQRTYEFNPVSGKYETLLIPQSSDFSSSNWRSTSSVGLNKTLKNFVYNINANLAQVGLEGTIVNSQSNYTTDRKYLVFIPDANFTYRPKKDITLIFSSVSNIILPQLIDLQPVTNSTNPLFIRLGNPILNPARTLKESINFKYVSPNNSYINLNSYITNYWNAFSTQSTVNPESKIQTVIPININGNYLIDLQVAVGKPTKIPGLNLNYSLSQSFSRNSNIIDNQKNIINRSSTGINGGINYKISKFQFNLRANGFINFIDNSLQIAANQKYYTLNNYLDIELELPKSYIIQSDATQMLFSGKNFTGMSTTNYIVNLGIIKYISQKNIGFGLYVYDVLNQSANVRRLISSTGRIEDTETNNLSRYFYVKMTYTLKASNK